jgi:ribose/xylose/arabinose/galactoside ABC-type transport system permease subunit
MEESAVKLAQFLAVLDLPVGILGIAVGLLAALRLSPRGRLPDLSSGGLLERIAVGLCGGVAVLGLIGTMETLLARRPDFPPLAVTFVVAVILSGLPAVVWRSRWRGAAEGVATMAIATAAILSGFSIGFLFVPLVVLMVWVCVLHLRVALRSPLKRDAASG